MRTSMRPITLRRIIEVAYLATNFDGMTPALIREKCGVSERRAKEIIGEMVDMKLLEIESGVASRTEPCTDLIGSVRSGSWDSVHTILLQHPFYREFCDTIDRAGPLTPDQILENLADSSLSFNKASIDVLSDWVERIGSYQKNVFTHRYYAVKPFDGPFLPNFLDVYHHLNTRAGIALRKRYVEIPRMREHVCEDMGISRAAFDFAFTALYQRNIGIIELSGAPVTTHAKTTKKRIKHITFSEMPEEITMDLSSDRVLKGIELGNRLYYYVAVHGGDLVE